MSRTRPRSNPALKAGGLYFDFEGPFLGWVSGKPKNNHQLFFGGGPIKDKSVCFQALLEPVGRFLIGGPGALEGLKLSKRVTWQKGPDLPKTLARPKRHSDSGPLTKNHPP